MQPKEILSQIIGIGSVPVVRMPSAETAIWAIEAIHRGRHHRRAPRDLVQGFHDRAVHVDVEGASWTVPSPIGWASKKCDQMGDSVISTPWGAKVGGNRTTSIQNKLASADANTSGGAFCRLNTR
jgi:hypothetical protein